MVQRFGSQVDMTTVRGVSVVGNMNNGCIVGLNASAAAACARVLRGEADARAVGEVDGTLYEHLKSRGFFEEPVDEKVLASAYLHVTQRCNLSCVGCYSEDAQRNVMLDPSYEQLEHAISELAKTGVRSLVISGGEPFLRGDLAEIVRFAKESCALQEVSVLTNGTLVSDEIANALAPYVSCVAVSFDGCSSGDAAHIRGRQRFDQLVEAVRVLQTAGVRVRVLPTIHARNMADIPRYAALAGDLGAELSFSLFSQSACNGELSDLLFREKDMLALAQAICAAPQARVLDAPLGAGLVARRTCGAGSSMVSVAADGSVFPCHMLHDERFCMGNAFEESLAEVMQGDVARLFASLDSRNCDGCDACDIRLFCGGGCRGRAVTGGEGVHGKDSYCEMIKCVYDHQMKAIASRLN